jgi:hypothetical protein
VPGRRGSSEEEGQAHHNCRGTKYVASSAGHRARRPTGNGSEDKFICLQEFAQLNPQFGVRFPLGKYDYPHMEPGSRLPAIKLAALGSPAASITPCNRMTIMLTDEPVD